MKKLIIFTAEPSNFVPENLKKEADKLKLEGIILNVNHLVIAEGVKDDGSLASQIFLVSKADKEGESPKIEAVEVDNETAVIPRLNEYNLEMKLSMLQRMADAGATLINSVRSMALCNDKLMSQVVLNSAGIKTPYSFTMHNDKDVEAMVGYMEEQGKLKFPVIVKTLRGTHGIGVMKIDSRSSLVSVAQMLLKEEIEFMVQEFIKHDQSARLIMIGDEMLAANLRGQPKDKDEFRTNSHLGSETEKYEPSEEELELGRKIVSLFGANFCAIDYIKHEDQLIVLEVNGSPGLEAIQKNWPDKNLAKTVVEFLTKSEVEAPKTQDNTVPGGTLIPNPLNLELPVADQPEVAKADEPDEDKLQEVEPVMIHRIFSEPIEGRIDTGAALCSLHADEIKVEKDSVKFKRGNITYTTSLDRTIKIKNVHGGDSTTRPVIKLDLTIHGIRCNGVEVSLTDRSKMKYEVLIGRNVLEKLGLPVQVGDNPNVDADVPETEIEEIDDDNDVGK